MQNYYPVLLQLKNRLCVVVGGGKVAARKIHGLLECGADIRVVSRTLSPQLETLFESGRIEYQARDYGHEVLDGAFLVVAATDSPEVNRLVAAHCSDRNIPVNVVDAPELGSFILPAAFRRGPLTVAVSTAGSSPGLARKISRDLESLLDEAYGELLEILADTRRRVLEDIADADRRRRVLTSLADEDLLAVLRAGGREALQERIDQIIGGF
jgi:precorrin-2 dehydrogenase / sirohydrochlorin ferrochelatase